MKLLDVSIHQSLTISQIWVRNLVLAEEIRKKRGGGTLKIYILSNFKEKIVDHLSTFDLILIRPIKFDLHLFLFLKKMSKFS